MREGNERLRVNVLLRARHADLIEAIRRLGWTQISNYVNLRVAPKNITAEQERKFLELTGRTSDELWPEFARSKEFLAGTKAVEITGEVTYRALQESGALRLPAQPDEILEEREFQEALEKAIGSLSPQQRTVIKSFFFDGKTLDVVGEEIGKSRERARQLKEQALNKLRRRRVSSVLQRALEGRK